MNIRLSFFILFLFASLLAVCQVSLCSWNLRDFGKTKSAEEIEFIANTVREFDVVAIQEVVAKDPGGAQAVARLADALNRKGNKWDYAISDITSGSSYKAERYAFLWKTIRVTLKGIPWLESKYAMEIDREPYYATFSYAGKAFTLVNFHAITKSMQPETEIKYFKFLPSNYPNLNLVFCGDFNCPQSHSVFNPLKSMGFLPALTNQKTSLRQKCFQDDCLASEFDNIFYQSSIIVEKESGIKAFYQSRLYFDQAQGISDHVPIWMKFDWN